MNAKSAESTQSTTRNARCAGKGTAKRRERRLDDLLVESAHAMQVGVEQIFAAVCVRHRKTAVSDGSPQQTSQGAPQDGLRGRARLKSGSNVRVRRFIDVGREPAGALSF